MPIGCFINVCFPTITHLSTKDKQKTLLLRNALLITRTSDELVHFYPDTVLNSVFGIPASTKLDDSRTLWGGPVSTFAATGKAQQV